MMKFEVSTHDLMRITLENTEDGKRLVFNRVVSITTSPKTHQWVIVCDCTLAEETEEDNYITFRYDSESFKVVEAVSYETGQFVITTVQSSEEIEHCFKLALVGDNDYILVTPQGIVCHALFNGFTGLYYADDCYRAVGKRRAERKRG